MAFQILNTHGQPIMINVIDQEVCELWGVEVGKKSYASAYTKKDESIKEISNHMLYNWHDVLGRLISDGAKTWEEVYERYWEPQQKLIDELQVKYPDENVEEQVKALPTVKRFLDLIEDWKSKGYTPLPVKE